MKTQAPELWRLEDFAVWRRYVVLDELPEDEEERALAIRRGLDSARKAARKLPAECRAEHVGRRIVLIAARVRKHYLGEDALKEARRAR